MQACQAASPDYLHFIQSHLVWALEGFNLLLSVLASGKIICETLIDDSLSGQQSPREEEIRTELLRLYTTFVAQELRINLLQQLPTQ